MKKMLLLATAMSLFISMHAQQFVNFEIQNATNCPQGIISLYAACKGTCGSVYTMNYSPGSTPAFSSRSYPTAGGVGTWMPNPGCNDLDIVAVDITVCGPTTTYQIGDFNCGYLPSYSYTCAECADPVTGSTTIKVDFTKVYVGPPPSSPYYYIIHFHY